MQERDDKVRIDKWLWAARFYKTRALAADAVEGGKVQLNGGRVKPSKPLRPGDALEIRQGPYRYSIMVRELSARRGPAAQAARLYAEKEESKINREQLKARLQMQPLHKGRPTKRARRQLQKFTDYTR
ncbi:MAG TPA: S4 domain-containing protein [Burkholderiales bacterium]|nr:S4 domain-containing protein [Burkholderiales bacterium]